MEFEHVVSVDTLSKIYHSAVMRERVEGESDRIRDKYTKLAEQKILSNNTDGLYRLIGKFAKEYDAIIDKSIELPRAGIVGEIYLIFHTFANKDVAKWLIDHVI